MTDQAVDEVALRKAAIVLQAVGAELAAVLLSQLPPAQAADVRRQAASLGVVTPTERDTTVAEFLAATESVAPGPELADPSAAQLTVGSERLFGCLQGVAGRQLLPLLRNEHPQTVAVVVSYMNHEQAAEALMGLPASLQSEVLRRLADLDVVDPLAVQLVEQQVAAWLRVRSHSTAVSESGMVAVRGIVDAAGAAGGSVLLANLRRHNHALVDRLTAGPRLDPPRAPLEFAQLIATNSETLRVVLREADPTILALALATSEPAVVARVAEHLPPASATQLLPAIHELGPTRLSDVSAAQQALCGLLHRLESEGRVRPPSSRLSVAA